MLSEVGVGDMPYSGEIRSRTGCHRLSQTAIIVLIADAAKQGDFEAILKLTSNGNSAGTVLDGLAKAGRNWALAACPRPPPPSTNLPKPRVGSTGLYHKALALASAGDFEGANKILTGEAGGNLVVNRRGALAQIEILSQLERNTDAIGFIAAALSPVAICKSTTCAAVWSRASPCPSPSRLLHRWHRRGVLHHGNGRERRRRPAYTMLHSRAAAYLRPDDNVEAILLTANLLEQQRQYDLAVAAYATIQPEDPAFYIAEIGRAESNAGRGPHRGFAGNPASPRPKPTPSNWRCKPRLAMVSAAPRNSRGEAL